MIVIGRAHSFERDWQRRFRTVTDRPVKYSLPFDSTHRVFYAEWLQHVFLAKKMSDYSDFRCENTFYRLKGGPKPRMFQETKDMQSNVSFTYGTCSIKVRNKLNIQSGSEFHRKIR